MFEESSGGAACKPAKGCFCTRFFFFFFHFDKKTKKESKTMNCYSYTFTVLFVVSFWSLLILPRYYDNYYYYSRPANVGQREYEDRNWYYQPDRYDDRPRYGDRNSAYVNFDIF